MIFFVDRNNWALKFNESWSESTDLLFSFHFPLAPAACWKVRRTESTTFFLITHRLSSFIEKIRVQTSKVFVCNLFLVFLWFFSFQPFSYRHLKNFFQRCHLSRKITEKCLNETMIFTSTDHNHITQQTEWFLRAFREASITEHFQSRTTHSSTSSK